MKITRFPVPPSIIYLDNILVPIIVIGWIKIIFQTGIINHYLHKKLNLSNQYEIIYHYIVSKIWKTMNKYYT